MKLKEWAVRVIGAAAVLSLTACSTGERTGSAEPCTKAVTRNCGVQAGSKTAPGGASAQAQASAKAEIVRIVFVDQEECCNCTKTRIDKSWDVLQQALGNPAALPVERLHKDTQAEQVEAYSVFKPIMVIPAIYFIDANNAVVDMIQGEVAPEQVRAILDRKP
jgi:hypothetical protein